MPPLPVLTKCPKCNSTRIIPNVIQQIDLQNHHKKYLIMRIEMMHQPSLRTDLEKICKPPNIVEKNTLAASENQRKSPTLLQNKQQPLQIEEAKSPLKSQTKVGCRVPTRTKPYVCVECRVSSVDEDLATTYQCSREQERKKKLLLTKQKTFPFIIFVGSLFFFCNVSFGTRFL